MENNYYFEFNLDEGLHRKASQEYINIYYAKNMRQAYNGLILGVFLIVLFSLMYFTRKGTSDGFSFFILGVSLQFIYQSLLYIFHIRRSKKQAFAFIDEDIDRINQSNKRIVVEFTEDEFIYADPDFYSKIKWHLFHDVRVGDEIICLDFNRGVQTSYILSKDYFGEETYHRIAEFVTKKIQNDIQMVNRKQNPELIDN